MDRVAELAEEQIIILNLRQLRLVKHKHKSLPCLDGRSDPVNLHGKQNHPVDKVIHILRVALEVIHMLVVAPAVIRILVVVVGAIPILVGLDYLATISQNLVVAVGVIHIPVVVVGAIHTPVVVVEAIHILVVLDYLATTSQNNHLLLISKQLPTRLHLAYQEALAVAIPSKLEANIHSRELELELEPEPGSWGTRSQHITIHNNMEWLVLVQQVRHHHTHHIKTTMETNIILKAHHLLIQTMVGLTMAALVDTVFIILDLAPKYQDILETMVNQVEE